MSDMRDDPAIQALARQGRIKRAIIAAAHDCEEGCPCDGDHPIHVSCASGSEVIDVEGIPDALAEAAEQAVWDEINQLNQQLRAARAAADNARLYSVHLKEQP